MEGTNLNEVFQNAIDKATEPGILQELVDAKVKRLVEDSLDSALTLKWGAARKAFEAKVSELLIPAIERWDVSRCNVKLETLLDDLVRESAIAERADILRRFKLVMSSDGMPESVTATQIAEEWEKWIAEDFDCDGWRVIDGKYAEFEAYEDVLGRGSGYSRLFEYATLHFHVDTDANGNNDRLNVRIPISRWRKEETWTVDRHRDLNVSDLRDIPDFVVWIYKLALAGTPVELDIDGCNVEYIQPASEPEYELR